MIISPVNPTSKLSNVGTTIFSVIGQLANEFNAINLSQGAPDFPCSADLRQQVELAMQANHNQYAPMTGLPMLKEQVSLKINKLYQRVYDVEKEILITASASQALYAAISALVHPGDEVIYFEPSFDSYAPIVRLQGAKAVGIKLTVPEFKIDWDLVKNVLNSKTKMIILNSPHNPSGSVMSQNDLNTLAELTRDTGIVILSDEVYEHMVFDGQEHLSMSSHAELATRSVVVTSFGKTFHVTGWRVGCCVAPASIMSEIVKVHQFMMFSADTPMQYAFCEHMKTPANYQYLADFYQSKRDLMIQELKSGPFEVLPSYGSFFMLISYGHLTQACDSEVVKQLIRKHGVATIPLSAFYSDSTDHKLIRLSFSKSDQTIIDGVRALNNFR
ncbi:methionine aminotransferase [Psychromonas sp. PT13]|uniref:methionine aminotransferase n=1 Tax=Psychromonas sp. PT13 TaxID=3439547 RepID=UPI003EC0569A